MTALFSLGDASIETVGTVLLDPLLDKFGLREVDADRNRVFIASDVEQIQSLIGKTAGIQREDFNTPRMLRDHVEQHHVFKAKTAGKSAGAVLRFNLFQ